MLYDSPQNDVLLEEFVSERSYHPSVDEVIELKLKSKPGVYLEVWTRVCVHLDAMGLHSMPALCSYVSADSPPG